MEVRASPLPLGEGPGVRASFHCFLTFLIAIAIVPHPLPFSLREKGVELPSPHGRGVGGEGLLPSPHGRGVGGEGLLPSPPGRGAGGEGNLAGEGHPSTHSNPRDASFSRLGLPVLASHPANW